MAGEREDARDGGAAAGDASGGSRTGGASEARDVIFPRPTPESVMEAIRPIHDPELMLSIVDLGLVYGAAVTEDGRSVEVRMTLTSPACPVGPELMAAVDHTVRLIPGVEEARVALVWDPPWDPTRMASEVAKEALGIW